MDTRKVEGQNWAMDLPKVVWCLCFVGLMSITGDDSSPFLSAAAMVAATLCLYHLIKEKRND